MLISSLYGAFSQAERCGLLRSHSGVQVTLSRARYPLRKVPSRSMLGQLISNALGLQIVSEPSANRKRSGDGQREALARELAKASIFDERHQRQSCLPTRIVNDKGRYRSAIWLLGE